MTKKIYVLGSINYDVMIESERFPKIGETLKGYNYIESVGGKGSNQAYVCAKLGAAVSMIGQVGFDEHGEKAIEVLKKTSIDVTSIEKTDKTHTGVAVILSSSGDNSIILDEGANGIISSKSISQALQKAERGSILICQFEIPVNTVLDAIKKAKSKNMITILNPAPAYQFDEDFYQYIDYLILNETETEILTGVFPNNKNDIIQLQKYFSSIGANKVVITLGDKGSIYIAFDKILKFPPMAVDTVDSTGAGDTFIGTFAYYLSKGEKIEDIMQLANIAGALSCLKYGAKEGVPSIQDIELKARS